MIVRTWSARATQTGADQYRAYFEQTLLPHLRALPGFSGGYLLSRDDAGLIELTTHTLWDSPQAIRAFTGPNTTTAIIEPQARTFLHESDPTVIHRTVLAGTQGC